MVKFSELKKGDAVFCYKDVHIYNDKPQYYISCKYVFVSDNPLQNNEYVFIINGGEDRNVLIMKGIEDEKFFFSSKDDFIEFVTNKYKCEYDILIEKHKTFYDEIMEEEK